MNKSDGLGMGLHQAASFSPPLARVGRSEAVFWPGCALMGLGPELLERVRTVLEREEPMGLSACCCGQPSRFLFPKAFPRRREKLRRLLERRGGKRVYTACPNCALQLRELGTVDVRPIWPVLAAHLRREDLSGPGGTYVIHDPCPLRAFPEEREAVRSLLALAGVTLAEPEHTGAHTLCCGNYHMMRALDGTRSEAMRRRRTAEFPDGMPVVSCCEGCLDAFRGEGLTGVHVLELLFGLAGDRGWGRRLRYTAGVGRKAPERRSAP